MSFQPPFAELYLQQKEYKTNQQTQRISTVRSQIKSEREINNSSGNSEGGNLAASKIRNLECPSYEICLIDYGCGKFNRKIHIMEQYP